MLPLGNEDARGKGDNFLPPLKRFTDTEIWQDAWFQELPPDFKLAYQYIWARCDNAGVWNVNKRLANFATGRDVDWPEFERIFTEHKWIEALPGGKWYLTEFIVFQYGKLSKECAPHRQVLRLLEGYGLHGKNGNTSGRVVKPLRKGSLTLKDKDKDKDKDSEAPQVRPRNPLFDALAEATGSNLDQLTKPAGATIGKALADIKAVSADLTPEDIRHRAAEYHRRHPDWALTAPALAKHWAEFSPPPKREIPPEPVNWRGILGDHFPNSAYLDETRDWSHIPEGTRQSILDALQKVSA